MRRWISFTLIAFVFALLHACSLDNDILKPNCEIFEVELIGKTWIPAASKTSSELLFKEDGILQEGNSADSITYTLQSCNSLITFNHTTGESREWTIQHLDLEKMQVKKGNEVVLYHPAK